MAPTTRQLRRGRSSEIPNPTAPTGRNLPAKGVSPGAAAQPLFGPEGVATTAGIERIDVDAIHPTTIHVRGADHGIHPGAKPSDDGFAGKTCRSDLAVDASPSGTVHACSLYQGSRPSLADYAPLGLSDSEFQRTSHASTAMSLAPFN